MNKSIRTVIVAPMTAKGRPYPTRVACTFQGKTGHVVLDQIRTVDGSRLTKRLGRIDKSTREGVLITLEKLFAPQKTSYTHLRSDSSSTYFAFSVRLITGS